MLACGYEKLRRQNVEDVVPRVGIQTWTNRGLAAPPDISRSWWGDRGFYFEIDYAPEYAALFPKPKAYAFTVNILDDALKEMYFPALKYQLDTSSYLLSILPPPASRWQRLKRWVARIGRML